MKPRHFILLRGLIREKEHWGDFVTHLQNSFPEAKIHSIDIPGAGDKYLMTCPKSIPEIVKIMHQELLNLNLHPHEPRVVLAVSLGGMLSAQWMLDYPHDFSHACLMNTSYSGISPLFHRLKPSALIHLLKMPFLKGRAKEKHILELISNVKERYEGDADSWHAIQVQRPVSVKNTLLQLLAAIRFQFPKTKPHQDLLVMACPMDRMVDVHCSHAIAKHWRTPIVFHPTAGHDLTGDDPAWVCDELKKWLI